jgi:plastocyanin
VDDQVHTATGMAYNGNTAPMNYKFQSDYTQQRGHVIDASEWSTGSVPAHGRSVVFVTKRPGNYFYACGYHISLGQIGVIVVVP